MIIFLYESVININQIQFNLLLLLLLPKNILWALLPCTASHCPQGPYYPALHCTALHCTALHCPSLLCNAQQGRAQYRGQQGPLTPRYSPYSKIRLHRRAVYSMRSPIKLGAFEQATKKVVQLIQADSARSIMQGNAR